MAQNCNLRAVAVTKTRNLPLMEQFFAVRRFSSALDFTADGEPITRVALDLGYDSVPAFITMFKRMLGASPRGYMRGARDSGGSAVRGPASTGFTGAATSSATTG